MDGFGQLTNPVPFDVGWFWSGLKIMYLFAFGLYGAFALVVLVQIKNMIAAVRQPFNAMIMTMGTVHLVVALLAILTAFMIL
jgi:hypothetical protein